MVGINQRKTGMSMSMSENTASMCFDGSEKDLDLPTKVGRTGKWIYWFENLLSNHWYLKGIHGHIYDRKKFECNSV